MQCISRRNGAKRKYYTEEDAIEAQKRMKTIHGVETEVYLCKDCGNYHIGRIQNMKTETKTHKSYFRVKNIYQGTATLYRQDGTTWNCPYRGTIEMGERIQSRIKEEKEVEAVVEFSTRGAALIVDFMELSKDTGMTLKEQKREYEELCGDY